MGKKTVVIAILVLASVLRLINIQQSFWLDEASQAQLSSLAIEQIWYGRNGDFHPPLFYLLAHYWQQVSTSEVWLRLLPVGFGVASIYALYRLTKELLDQKTAVVAALLLAINPYHIYYSQEFRMYSLVGLLAVLSMWALVKRHKSLFILNALLVFTHYSTTLLLAAQLIYAVFARRDLVKFVIRHLFLVILLYIPWFPQFARQLAAGVNIDNYLPGWRDVLSLPLLKSPFIIFFKFVAGRIDIFPRLVYAVYILFVLGTCSLALVLSRKHRTLLYSWVFLPVAISVLLSLSIPQTQPFRLIFVLPALMIVFSQAVMRFPRLFLTMIIYFSIVGIVMQNTRPRLQREQWREAIDYLQQQNQTILVKFSDRFATFAWYTPQLNVVGAVPSYPANNVEVEERLSADLGDHVFVLDYLGELTDPEKTVDAVLLKKGYRPGPTRDFSGVGFVHLYQRP